MSMTPSERRVGKEVPGALLCLSCVMMPVLVVGEVVGVLVFGGWVVGR